MSLLDNFQSDLFLLAVLALKSRVFPPKARRKVKHRKLMPAALHRSTMAG